MPSLRPRRSALLLAVTALLAVAGQQAATAKISADPGVMTIGTYNIRAGVGTDDFAAAVGQAVSRFQVAGLQEVNSRAKEGVLNGLSAWGYYRAERGKGEQTPVVWDSRLFRFLSARSAQISASGYVGDELPGSDGHLDPNYVTVVHLEHLYTGTRFSVVNVHTIHGAVRAGEAWPGRPRVFDRYLHEVARIGEITAHEKEWGPVYVLGDFNVGWVQDDKHRRAGLPFRTFRALGMRANWATEHPDGYGTRGTALLDQVWSVQAARTATVENDITVSDHVPGTGNYRVPLPQ